MCMCVVVCEYTVLNKLSKTRKCLVLLDHMYYNVPSVCCQVLLQGLQNLNRAVHQDVVAVQLLPRDQWVAPSSVVLQDEGAAKDDDAEEEEDRAVNLSLLN